MRRGLVLDLPRLAGAVAATAALGGAVWLLVAVEEGGQLDPVDVWYFPALIAAGALGAFAAPRLRERSRAIAVSVVSSVVLFGLGLVLLPIGLPVLVAGALTLVTTVWVKKGTG